MKERGGNKTEQRKKSHWDAGLMKPWLAQWGALKLKVPISIAPLAQKQLGLYTLPHLVSGCWLPWERFDLGWHRLLQLRQTQRELRAGGCVFTMLPSAGSVLPGRGSGRCIFMSTPGHYSSIFN